MDSKMANSSIEVLIKGTSPETTRARDIAEILKSIETMLEASITQEHPEIDREQLVISLVGIHSSALGLKLASPANGVMVSAFRSIGRAVSTSDYSNLPLSSIDSLETLMSYTRRWQCDTDFIINDDKIETVATITPDTIISQIGFLKGETNLYGLVVRVGGVKPVVRLETINGQSISCEGDIETIKKLGEKLYSRVGVSGTAYWNQKSLEIRHFRIKDILPYQDTPIDEAFKELAVLAGSYYNSIDDVEEYLKKLRSDEIDSE